MLSTVFKNGAGASSRLRSGVFIGCATLFANADGYKGGDIDSFVISGICIGVAMPLAIPPLCCDPTELFLLSAL